jgi:chromosome segregation ATPase
MGASGVYTKSIVTKYTSAPTTNLAYRNYVKDVETLRKELDRKDARNSAIANEMKNLRVEFSTQQRELRILSGAFEKCNNERVLYQNEVSRNKEYIDKLELQISRLGNGAQLIQTVDKLQLTNEHYASELSNLKGVVAFKDEKITELERSLDAFHKSVELQHQIEGSSGSALGGGKDSEATMKTLYYELGKRQTDAHSLAISLAATNSDLKSTREALQRAKTDSETLRKEVVALKSNSSLMNQQGVRDKDEISQLLDKNSKFKGLNQRLQGMVEDLSKRLREEREAFLTYKSEKDANEAELTHTLENANKEVHHLRLRQKNLDDAVKMGEKQRTAMEEALAKETRKMDDERKVYATKIREGMQASDKNKVLNMQLEDALRKKDGASAWSVNSPAHDFSKKMEDRVDLLTEELAQARDTEAQLLHDREASVRALQQTIEATRELSTRYNEEKKKRVESESKLAAVESRLARTERELAVATSDTTTAPFSSQQQEASSAAHTYHRNQQQQAGSAQVSFVEESEIFAPPVPPPTAIEQQRHQQRSSDHNTTDDNVKPSTVRTSSSAMHSPGDRGAPTSTTSSGSGSGGTTMVCKSFEQSGSCRFGDKCRFRHGNTSPSSTVRHSADNNHNSLRDSNSSVISDTSTSSKSTAASSVADELARLRAELREIEQQKP